jgi:glycerophosphoryl diester phosphodiesterase
MQRSANCLAMHTCDTGAVAATRILVQGHRGARGVRPENTLEAFAYAITAGADAVELDMVVTRHNALVISHDPVKDSGKGLPSLDDVFDLLAPTSIELNLEAKTFPDPERFVRLLLERIAAHSMASRVMVSSFDFPILHAMRRLAPAIRRAALTEDDPRGFPEIARDGAGAQCVNPHYTLVTADKVRLAHDAGLQVIPWTVNAPADWARMVDAGVDAIIADDPAALIAWLSARGLR